MRVPSIVAVAAVALTAAAASAQQGPEMLKIKGCMTCHDMQTSVLAPSFQDIHRRFAGLSNAKAMLMRVVVAGSDAAMTNYHWGPQKMPSEAARMPVSEAEATVMVEYILGMK
jgi:cytochrome c